MSPKTFGLAHREGGHNCCSTVMVPTPVAMPTASSAESQLMTQFRMTHKEASEALANNATSSRSKQACRKPWVSDSKTVAEETDLVGLPGKPTPSTPSTAYSQFSKSQPEACEQQFVSSDELEKTTDEEPKVDATETTVDWTESSENLERGDGLSSETSHKEAEERLPNEAGASTSVLSEESVVGSSVLIEANNLGRQDTTKALKANSEKVDKAANGVGQDSKGWLRNECLPHRLPHEKSFAKHTYGTRLSTQRPVTPSKSSCFAVQSLENKLMRDYSISYTKARVVVKEARAMLRLQSGTTKELERRCQSLILFKGKEDFRNVVLRTLEERQVAKRDPLTVGRPSIESLIMSQHKLVYSSAKRLADMARAELGMKPWDQWTDELKSTCDRLHREVSTNIDESKQSFDDKMSAVEDARRFFETFCSETSKQADHVFRRIGEKSPPAKSIRKNDGENRLEHDESIEVELGAFESGTQQSSFCTSCPLPEESVEITLGKNIGRERDQAEAIHVVYENSDSTDCYIEEDDVAHLGDVVEQQRSTKTTPTQVKFRVQKKARQHVQKTGFTTCPKVDPLVTKIQLDRKGHKTAANSICSFGSEDHSTKTIRTKNTKKPQHGKCESNLKSSQVILPVKEESSSHSQSNDEHHIIAEVKDMTPMPKSMDDTKPQTIKQSRSLTQSPTKSTTSVRKFLNPTKKQTPRSSSPTKSSLPAEEEILESILMSHYGASPTTASRVVTKARTTTNFPQWTKWNKRLLVECERQLYNIQDKAAYESDGTVSESFEETVRCRAEAKDAGTSAAKQIEHPKPNQSVLLGAVVASGLAVAQLQKDNAPETTMKVASSSVVPLPRDLPNSKNSHADPSPFAHPAYNTELQWTGSDAMARPLETVLIHRHRMSWKVASDLVRRGRQALGMSESEAWTPQLEEHCEQELMEATSCSSYKESVVTLSLAESKSIVVSVGASQRELQTEVGKDWTEHTLEECSVVSRCPSRANDLVIVEQQTEDEGEDGASVTSDSSKIPFKTAASANEESDASPQGSGVPPVIYLRLGQRPEVPHDEPLEAQVGLPYISARFLIRANRKASSQRRLSPFLRRLRGSLRRLRRKATGFKPQHLQEDDTECRVQTLMSL